MSDNLTHEEKEMLDEAEEYFQRKMEWLKDHNYSNGDVMEDEDGKEYVMDRPDEDGKMDRIYLNDVVK